MNAHAFAAGVCAVTLAAMLGYLGWRTPAPEEAPDITVVTTTGKKLALAHMRGKPLLVTFWATTCPGCLDEIPKFVTLYHELSPQGLQIIAIATAANPPNLVLAAAKSYRIPYTIAFDLDARASRAFRDNGITPTTFLIAPDGRIVYRKTGSIDLQKARAEILGMLKRHAAPHG